MPQETRVIAMGETEGDVLRARLAAQGWTSRAVAHARFSYAGEGVTATLYRSGKLVVQGSDLDLFATRFLGAPDALASSGILDDERIGTDEAGKGDYFGPLVVAAVFVARDDIARLRRIGVRDGKTMSYGAVERVAAAVEVSTPHEVIELAPPEYNRRQAETGNVNRLLGELHAAAIVALAARVPCRRVLTDEFGDPEHVARNLGARRGELELEARPRAEQHVAVAAASVLARDRFLRGLRRLSDDVGIDLPKGAGEPVDAAARKALAVFGPDGLGRVAKVHFRTTQRLLGKGGG